MFIVTTSTFSVLLFICADIASELNEFSDANPEMKIYFDHFGRGFENVNNSRIYVIGHSHGAEAMMSVGIANNRIERIVVVGTPRRVKSRILERSAPEIEN